MSKIDNLVSRLHKVKRVGKDSFIAICPAHDDKSPSLAIREIEQDKILLKCFAGCDVESIIGAIGLDYGDIMPDSAPDDVRKARKIPFSASDVLACTKNDASLLYLAMCDLDKGIVITKDHITLLKKSAARIYAAAQMGGQ